MSKLKEVVIYSPINDHRIKAYLKDSPIWKLCFHKEELTKEIIKIHRKMYVYRIKFDGLIPIQHMSTKAM